MFYVICNNDHEPVREYECESLEEATEIGEAWASRNDMNWFTIEEYEEDEE